MNRFILHSPKWTRKHEAIKIAFELSNSDVCSLEPVLKRLEDSEQASELPESKMEVSVIFPACSEASEMLQP